MNEIIEFLLENEYEYKTKNTLEHFSLHDCFVDKMLVRDDKMLLYLSHMEVLESHPLNDVGCAQCSDEGIIIFDKMKICNIKLCDDGEVDLNYGEFMSVFEGMEFLQTEYLGEENGFYKFHFLVDRHEQQNVIGEFNIVYKEVTICWNKYIHDSWFVNFKQD